MLKKMSFGKKLTYALIFFILSLSLFSLGVFVLGKTPFEQEILIRYTIISGVIAVYALLIMSFNLNFAFPIFVVGYLFAFGLFIYNSIKNPIDYVDTTALITWFVIMGLDVALGLSLETLLRSRIKNRELKKELERAKEEEKLRLIEEKEAEEKRALVRKMAEEKKAETQELASVEEPVNYDQTNTEVQIQFEELEKEDEITE